MSSRSVGVVTRSLRRQQQANTVGHEQDDDDDDDVVESTASAFDQAKRNRSRGSRPGSLLVDVESGGTTTTTKVSKNRSKHQPDQSNDEINNSTKSNKTVVAPVEELKFNCPICFCPFTEEMTTKCGHIFCKSCIKDAISRQAKCPTCRKDVNVKDLI